ncbi:SRPBCC family protein [Streptodolium elevatio]|uniref:SRPBCC family protein n=1 Tax=Streptodolium elevatio TaxID=3157996 RepID=A0ABV3DQV0_9ACTN
MARFVLVTHIEAEPRRVFEASLDVGVHTASMAGACEEAVAGVTDRGLVLGDTVTWRARHFGVWWRMTAEITAYEPAGFFVDEQRRGPFRSWRHEHHFVADGDATTMRDTVAFAAPFGPVGRLAEAVVLRRYMARLISNRNRHLKQTLEH